MNFLVACYKFSPGLISGGIRWWSHSHYSHVAIVHRDDDNNIISVYEAVERGFVRVVSLSENHAPGTFVDLFRYDPPKPEAGLALLDYLVGQGYDFAGVASFITGGAIPENPCRVFCSEAAGRFAIAAGKPFQNCPPQNLLPRDIAMSLALTFVQTIELP